MLCKSLKVNVVNLGTHCVGWNQGFKSNLKKKFIKSKCWSLNLGTHCVGWNRRSNCVLSQVFRPAMARQIPPYYKPSKYYNTTSLQNTTILQAFKMLKYYKPSKWYNTTSLQNATTLQHRLFKVACQCTNTLILWADKYHHTTSIQSITIPAFQMCMS